MVSRPPTTNTGLPDGGERWAIQKSGPVVAAEERWGDHVGGDTEAVVAGEIHYRFSVTPDVLARLDDPGTMALVTEILSMPGSWAPVREGPSSPPGAAN